MTEVPSINEIIAVFGGMGVGVLALFSFILSILMPLIIYFIHRSTRRTAIATEKIAKQNQQLIELLNSRESFSLGDPNNDLFLKKSR